jgi:hypothetical protein
MEGLDGKMVISRGKMEVFEWELAGFYGKKPWEIYLCEIVGMSQATITWRSSC